MRVNAIRIILAGSMICLLMLIPATSAGAGEFAKFDFDVASAELSTLEAGAHPDFTTTISFTTDPNSPEAANGDHYPYAYPRNITVSLPPGLVGNLSAVEQCDPADFVIGAESGSGGCPFSSQVGVAKVRLYGQDLPNNASVFSLVPSGENTVARLGFYVLSVPTFINVHVRSDSDFGVTAKIEGIASNATIEAVKTTLWGAPGDPSHDHQRFTSVETNSGAQESPARPTGAPSKPFITNPTACGLLQVSFQADNYQDPVAVASAEDSLGAITGCAQVPFAPSLDLVPDNPAAGSPSGISAALTIPQDESVAGRASSHLRDAIIQLPEGIGISAAAADGLEACDEAEVGYGASPPAPAQCPLASKIATAEIDSPALTRTLQGAVYQRTPEPGHLARAWLVADDQGLHLKIPGEFQLDPHTGRITSLFLDTPQVPMSQLRLRFKGGPRGVLATPRRCGTYEASYELTPWSGLPAATGAAPMTFSESCGRNGFAPMLLSGTVEPAAGKYSSLITEVTQESGEQNLARLELTLPPGLLAKLKGVPICPDEAAVDGTCPAVTQVGHASVASGPGPNPLWIPQPGRERPAVYLAGPYNGAPYSLVILTPVQAGPFDLGDVVVRTALHVDTRTARVSAVSDALPQILEGVPVSYRAIRIEIDRPDFILNPTSCDTLETTGAALSAEGTRKALGDRFQVGGCRKLAFKPKLHLSLLGSPRRAGHPAVSAVLTMPAHGANIAWSRVTLPRSEQIDNAHIRTPCTRPQFNERACPKSSILGVARAFSPLLDKPLEGPVYFRSNGGARTLPDLVADLRGQIHVVLVGYIDSKHHRVRTTFGVVPDAPISKFQLRLFGKKRGLLTNNRHLCGVKNRALLQFNGQNGKTFDSSQTVRVNCGKHDR